MSKAQAEIANKIVDIIIKADEKELLRQGVNTIETIIDDCKMLLKVFIDTKGNVQNINGYPLISETARKLGNVITMLE